MINPIINFITYLAPSKYRKELRSYLKLRFFKFGNFRKIVKNYEISYPKNILSYKDTLNEIINKRKSISRFGDGEYTLIAGGEIYFQSKSKKLRDRLIEVLNGNNENCLVCISYYSDHIENRKKKFFQFDHWEYGIIRYGKKILKYLNPNKVYGAASISRLPAFYRLKLEDIKKIWDNKNVLFIIGKNSHFFFDDRIFDNIKRKEIIYSFPENAFSDYDRIFSEVKKYDPKKWIVFLSLGPTATILSYDLSKIGYHALDLGHLPNCYAQYLGEKKNPEEEFIKRNNK